MSRMFTLCTFAILISATAFPQAEFGVKAGVNVSKLSKEISIPTAPEFKTNTGTYIGYQVGLFGRIPFNKHLAFALQMNFSTTGSTFTLNMENSEEMEVKERLTYIDVPLLFEYRLGPAYMGGGPSFAFLISSKLQDAQLNELGSFDYKKMDVAANAVAGVRPLKRLDLMFRYSYGLLNIQSDPGYSETKNRFFNISLLYTVL